MHTRHETMRRQAAASWTGGFWAGTLIVLGLATGCSQECPIGQEDHDDDPNTACVEGYACGGGVCPHVPWTTQFGTSAYDYGLAGSVSDEGNVYVGGSFGGAGAFVHKYDSGGAELWTDQFGGSQDGVRAAAAAPDDGVVVAGSQGSQDLFVYKYSASGTRVWSQNFGTPEYDLVQAAAVDDTGDVYVLGETEGAFAGQQANGNRDVFLRKYNASGNEVWTRQFGTSAQDLAGGLAIDPVDGAVLIAGTTSGPLGGSSAGAQDAFVRKYSGDGSLVWTRQFGTSQADAGMAIDVGLSGRIYVAGTTYGALASALSGSGDAFVRVFDSGGSTIWTRQFGTSQSTEGVALAVDRHEQVFVAGRVRGSFSGTSSAGDWDAFVRKLDDQGSSLATYQFGSSVQDRLSSVAVDEASNVFLVGTTDGTLPGQTSAGARDPFVAKRLL